MMRNLSIADLSLLLVALLVACSPTGREEGENGHPKAKRSKTTAATSEGPPGADDLANATFSGIADEPVRLEDGIWEGEPYQEGAASRPSVRLVEDFLLAGDLNGDGAEEAVALLAGSSGGSGTRLYVTAAGWVGSDAVEMGTALIGDRVQVKSARVASGRIEMEVVQAGPGDAMCCPSQRASRRWALRDQGLEELDSEVRGSLSVEDLAGMEWVLSHWDWKEPAPPEPEVTLVFEEGRIGGSDGCNRYFAEASDGEMPGDLGISAAGTTRMACPPERMEVETRYLAALASARSYSFLAGRLAIGYESGDSMHTLMFEPRELGNEE